MSPATESIEWKDRIVQLVLVKQRLAEVDVQGIWPFHLPRVAASEEQLGTVESLIGERLDESLRCFLLHADGWPAFFQTVDLFGSPEFTGGAMWHHATQMLGLLGDYAFASTGITQRDVIPIAASLTDLDLFLMVRRCSPSAGTVIWFAGSEVDRFPSFDECFLATIDYNRSEIVRFEKGARDQSTLRAGN